MGVPLILQKLLFAHTEYGDLTPIFSGFFDTRIGAKMESPSYRKIAEHIGFDANEILFLSDIEQELNAAQLAGIQTIWLVRDSIPLADAAHYQVRDFSEIQLA
jgi:enolase-phosphatase E1